MNIPLISLIIISFISLLMSANSHGKPHKREQNFWVAFIAAAIQWGLLWAAGIFKLL